MKVFDASKPRAMRSLLFSNPSSIDCSKLRFLKNTFSSSVIWMTRGTLKVSCSHLNKTRHVRIYWIKSFYEEFLLCHNQRNQVTKMQRTDRWTQTSIEIEFVAFLIVIEQLMKITMREENSSAYEGMYGLSSNSYDS